MLGLHQILIRIIRLTPCEDYTAGGINKPESTRHVKIIE